MPAINSSQASLATARLALKQRFPRRVFGGGVVAPALVNRPVWARWLIGFMAHESLQKQRLRSVPNQYPAATSRSHHALLA